MTVTVATLGFPRIGPRRELKFALEDHWAGKTDAQALARNSAAAASREGASILPAQWSSSASFSSRRGPMRGKPRVATVTVMFKSLCR